MSEKQEKKSSGKGLLVGLIGLLAAGNIGQGVWHYMSNDTQTIKIAEQVKAIDSLAKEKEEYLAKVTQLEADLTAAIAKSDSLGIASDDLKRDLEELKKDKRVFLSQQHIRAGQLAELKDKIGNYELMLRQQEDEIRNLKVRNDSLYKYNGELKTVIVAKEDTISKLEREKSDLKSENEKGKVLVASAFSVTAIKNPDKNKKVFETTQTYRNKDLVQAQVDFEIGANPIADIEEKQVYVQILSPSKDVLYNTSNGGGTFEVDGKTMNYSVNQNIMYNQSTKKMSLIWVKPNDLAAGVYQIKVWCEEKEIGKGSFTISK
jgi:hypothetical protein